jgi:hypothetical protein
VLVGSLVGQDYSKMLIAATVLVGVVMNSAELRQITSEGRDANGIFQKLDAPRLKSPRDTAIFGLFNPARPDEVFKKDMSRPQKPPEEAGR